MSNAKKDLENTVDRINSMSGSPVTSYTQKPGAENVANIGNYYIDYAYGGVALYRIVNSDGTVSDIFGGHFTKRELYARLHAFLTGYEACMNEKPRKGTSWKQLH